MPHLTVTQLDKLPTFQVTPEVIANGHPLTPTQIAARWHTARHEAAHFTAACACPGSHIWRVQVPTKGKGLGWGSVDSVETRTDEACFVTLAGYEWECEFGNPALGGSDYENATKGDYSDFVRDGGDLHLMRQVTREFVLRHRELIDHVAAGLLTLSRKNGVLDGRALIALVRWTRKRAVAFRFPSAI